TRIQCPADTRLQCSLDTGFEEARCDRVRELARQLSYLFCLRRLLLRVTPISRQPTRTTQRPATVHRRRLPGPQPSLKRRLSLLQLPSRTPATRLQIGVDPIHREESCSSVIRTFGSIPIPLSLLAESLWLSTSI